MAEPRNGYEFLKQLAERKDEVKNPHQEFYAYLDSKARKKGIPLHGQFELTPLCNFDCRMCYVHLTKAQMQERNLLMVEDWKDLIHQAWKAGMIDATLTGGECLTYPGFREIYLYLRSLGCEVNVMTNGALMNDEWIRFFQENKPAQIQITLYGQNEEVYERVTGQRSFAVVAENIRKLQLAGLPISLSVTPSKYLGEDVFETIRFGKTFGTELAVNNFLMDPREETGRSGQQDEVDIDFYVRLLRFLDEKEEKVIRVIPEEQLPPIGGPTHECQKCGLQCGGGRSSFNIDWKGIMYPCNQLSMIKGYPLRTSFSDAWKQINRTVENWPRVPECEGCAYEPVCSNCAAQIVRFTAPGKRPTALCEQTRYLVQHGVRHIPECE